MLLETGKHPSELKDIVATPGGTTFAGLKSLEKGNFRSTIMDAVEAATTRSRELGAVLNSKKKDYASDSHAAEKRLSSYYMMNAFFVFCDRHRDIDWGVNQITIVFEFF